MEKAHIVRVREPQEEMIIPSKNNFLEEVPSSCDICSHWVQFSDRLQGSTERCALCYGTAGPWPAGQGTGKVCLCH